MLTLVPATLWGFADRGLIREGMAADLVVFDPDTIAAEMPEVVDDLPAGARRLVQRTRGIAATVVNGEVLLRDGKHTGALPGPAAARAGRAEGVSGGDAHRRRPDSSLGLPTLLIVRGRRAEAQRAPKPYPVTRDMALAGMEGRRRRPRRHRAAVVGG